MINQFKPALLFLVKFLGVYIIGNVLYGLYINSWYPGADPLTAFVTEQSAGILRLLNIETVSQPMAGLASISLVENGDTIVNVFEGCNGLNVMIVFLAFLTAYQGTLANTIWFSLTGLIIIHISNLGRILLLYHQARTDSPYFYYTHKYLFTAIIYGVVILLWAAWVLRFNGKK